MKKLPFLLLVIAIIGQSCLKREDCQDCYNAPIQFGLTLLPVQVGSSEYGTSLIPEVYKTDTIQLYYIDNSVKKKVNFGYGDSRFLGIFMVTTDISVVSASKNIKTFYLYLNKEDTDTIYFDCKLANDGCCTYYTYDSLSYNGKKLNYHQSSGIHYAVKQQPIVR